MLSLSSNFLFLNLIKWRIKNEADEKKKRFFSNGNQFASYGSVLSGANQQVLDPRWQKKREEEALAWIISFLFVGSVFSGAKQELLKKVLPKNGLHTNYEPDLKMTRIINREITKSM